MWEWSLSQKKSSSSSKNSLLKAYEAYLPKKTLAGQEKAEETPAPQQMEKILRQQITAYGLKDISLKLTDFQPLSWEKKHRYSEEQVRGRKIFLKILGYSHRELCLEAGLSEADIELLRQSISPENYNVHVKIPFDFGGRPTMDNMCLVRTHPMHDNLHALLEYQLEKNFLKQYKKLYIPIIEGLVKNA